MKQIDLQQFLNDPAALPRSTALLLENGLRAILLHLKPGEEIPEHQTRGAITVQCLQGEATFRSGQEPVELKQHTVIMLGPNAPHSVSARSEALLLVTMSTPVTPTQ
jgi:quercetin dioxygenase-like cupin family protein